MIGKKIAGLPFWAIVLDGLGTLLVVGGLLIVTGVLPEAERDMGLALVVGAPLMAPLIVAIVRKATDRE